VIEKLLTHSNTFNKMRPLLTLLFLSITSLAAIAQHVLVQGGVEKTVSGLEYSALLSYETKRLWAAGSFYQTGLSRQNTEGELKQKNIFYGIQLQAPVVRCERMALLFNMRAGFVNRNFFALVPSVETRIRVNNKVSFSLGTGFRMAYPALSGKLVYQLF
jgi:hypothetical protein